MNKPKLRDSSQDGCLILAWITVLIVIGSAIVYGLYDLCQN